MTGRLNLLFSERGIDCWGICAFDRLGALLPCRAAVRLPRESRSVIAVLLPYRVGDFPERNVARYAVTDDYHTAAMELLRPVCAQMGQAYPAHRWEPFVDSSPIPEVRAAYLAGLGVIGRHGQLIHPRYGAYCCVAAIVTTARLPRSRPLPGNCLDCGKCGEACPTGALRPSGCLDKTLCRSFLTQKKRGLTEWERAQIAEGNMAWGCDICLDACPMHRSAAYSILSAFLGRADPVLREDNLDSLMAVKSYGYRGKAVLLRNLELIRPHIRTTTGS